MGKRWNVEKGDSWAHYHHGFVMFPHLMIASKRLSASAIRIGNILMVFDKGKYKKGWVCPSLRLLEACSGLTKQTVERAIKELQKQGFLEIRQEGAWNKSNIYFMRRPLLSPEDLVRDYRILALKLRISDLQPIQDREQENALTHFFLHLHEIEEANPEFIKARLFEKLEQFALGVYQKCNGKKCGFRKKKEAEFEIPTDCENCFGKEYDQYTNCEHCPVKSRCEQSMRMDVDVDKGEDKGEDEGDLKKEKIVVPMPEEPEECRNCSTNDEYDDCEMCPVKARHEESKRKQMDEDEDENETW